MKALRKPLLAVALSSVVACGEATAPTPEPAPSSAPPVTPPEDPPDDPPDDPPIDPPPNPPDSFDCVTPGTAMSLPELALRFANEIDPLMARATGGCVACHAATSDRLMRMAETGEDTFYRVRAEGYLRPIPGGIADRVIHETMPADGVAWSTSEKLTLSQFACDLALIDDVGVPPDEEFPPELLSPYYGAAITDYDDTFLTYDQLRGRVLIQFDDDWVRLGVDEFSENITLFGGVDFIETFVPAREATPEYLLGLDVLSEDVCRRAADNGTGPFVGLDVDAVIGAAPIAPEEIRTRLRSLFQGIVMRPPAEEESNDEIASLYDVLLNLEAADSDRHGAWAGICQALIKHPDFLFTRAPSFDSASAEDRERFLVIKSALDLIDRPATADELGRFDLGATRADLVEEWLHSPEFAGAYRRRVQNVLEYDGTPDGDEPARLWTYLALNDRPMSEVLTAGYSVDDDLQRVERPPEHGMTGVLTMRGYMRGKPGLPHYSYAARVLTGFMGVVFNVPQEVLDARSTATVASTVSPGSVCYSCHQLLTPLSHQRLRWDDSGAYRTTFEDGRPIDDSDQDLVAGYPFRGRGMESFSLVAARKEGFIRRMINVHFLFSFGRNMRHELDERDVYKALWDAAQNGQGTFKDVIKGVLFSRSYTDPPAPTEEAFQ